MTDTFRDISPGDPLPRGARTWSRIMQLCRANNIPTDAIESARKRGLSPSVIKAKFAANTNLRAGSVYGAHQASFTSQFTREPHVYATEVSYGAIRHNLWGVIQQPTDSGESVVEMVTEGLCVAVVDVRDRLTAEYCSPIPGHAVLVACDYGPVRILEKAELTTNHALCLVDIRKNRRAFGVSEFPINEIVAGTTAWQMPLIQDHMLNSIVGTNTVEGAPVGFPANGPAAVRNFDNPVVRTPYFVEVFLQFRARATPSANSVNVTGGGGGSVSLPKITTQTVQLHLHQSTAAIKSTKWQQPAVITHNGMSAVDFHADLYCAGVWTNKKNLFCGIQYSGGVGDELQFTAKLICRQMEIVGGLQAEGEIFNSFIYVPWDSEPEPP